MKHAVIGIGSNSVRMLITDINGRVGTRLRRDRAGTRLFAGLGPDGRLDEAAMEKTVDAVAAMAEAARAEGCVEVLLFATSATRDAANQADFAALLRERAGVELTVTPGEEEAALSFLGATGPGRCGVIDIGGGSTEIVVGEGDRLDAAFSCQMGAVRLSRMLPIASVADMEPVIALADGLLAEKLPEGLALPESWYATGGTFTTLAALQRGGPWELREGLHGTLLRREKVEELGRLLADMPMEERLRLPQLQPARADIIVHGICILIACMRRLGIAGIRVSEYGNLDGYTKKHYGLTELR